MEMESGKGLELAVIGNCAYNALINQRGSVVWCCLPRFDGDPVFCSLLRKNQDIGFFDIEVHKSETIQQKYVENTAVLQTTITDSQGGSVEIMDFAPRFKKFERVYRPNMIVRLVAPVAGRPRIRIRLRPTFGYGWGVPEKTRGSNHIRYLLPTMTLRLTTNAPVSYIVDEVQFELEEPIQLVLMPDESLTEAIGDFCTLQFKTTVEYWRDWAQNLTIPFEWQQEVIRSCITLKLLHFEETGAIVGAATTSIPSSPIPIFRCKTLGGKIVRETRHQNLDLRYCFLEDAYCFTSTLRDVGVVGMMQEYLRFIANLVACFGTEGDGEEAELCTSVSCPTGSYNGTGSGSLCPVYGIAMETKLFEREMHRLAGYRAMAPVVCGNGIFVEKHLHVYGSVVLAMTQLFYDNRLNVRGDVTLFHRLESLTRRAVKELDKLAMSPSSDTEQVDLVSGGVENKIRGAPVYTHVVLWGACDRLAKISQKLKLTESRKAWTEAALQLQRTVLERGLHPVTRDHFVASIGDKEVEPRLLLLPEIGFIKPTDPKFLKTLEVIEQRYKRPGSKFIVVDNEWSGLQSINPHTGLPIPTPSSSQHELHHVATPSSVTAALPTVAATAPVSTTSLPALESLHATPPVTARFIHTFWYISALAMAGRKAEARELFEYMLTQVNSVGLLSDSIDIETGELWGNFPMTNCQGAFLRCAHLLSRKWHDEL